MYVLGRGIMNLILLVKTFCGLIHLNTAWLVEMFLRLIHVFMLLTWLGSVVIKHAFVVVVT